MKTRVDSRLLDEARRLRLRFACEDCVHFDEARQQCSLGYAPSPRRVELEGGARAGEAVREVELCKTYELA